MSPETRSVGISILLSLAIVATASLSARLYKDQRDVRIAQAKMLETSSVACR